MAGGQVLPIFMYLSGRPYKILTSAVFVTFFAGESDFEQCSGYNGFHANNAGNGVEKVAGGAKAPPKMLKGGPQHWGLGARADVQRTNLGLAVTEIRRLKP